MLLVEIPGGIFLEEVGEAGNGVGVVRDKLVIKPGDAEEVAKFGNAPRGLHIPEGLYLISRHSDPLPTGDSEAKEVAFLTEPLALVGFKAEAVLSERLENLGYLDFVLFEGSLGIDDDVVEIRVAEDAEVRVEYGVDESLEYRGGGGEAHGHDSVFEESIEGFEGGCRLRAGGDSEIREAGANVHGGDPVGSCEVVHDRPGQWDWVLIQLNFAVEVSVIDDESKLSGTGAR